MGCNASRDQQHFYFEENHVFKKRVKFNRGGYGYLYDIIFAYVFTYSMCPSNMPAPKEYTDKGYSPLHSHVLAF